MSGFSTLAISGLTWLTPLTGAIVAAAVVPPLVALYFLKLRRKSAAVPSTLLWKRSVEDLRANAPFQRLRFNILLLLQLLLLAFVAFALAQPRMDIGASAGLRTVILIDRSASMGATDLGEGRTRLEEAKRRAADLVERHFAGGLFAASPGEMMVVAFSDGAEVLQPFTRSKADALRAIESIEPTDGGSSISEALALSRAYTTVTNPDDPKAVLSSPVAYQLFSDGRISDLGAETARPGEEFVFHVTGRADATNAGIEGIAAERSSADPSRIQVFVNLRNDSVDPVETELQLAVDGTVRAVTPSPVRIPGGGLDPQTGLWRPGTLRHTFPPIIQPRAGALAVEVMRADSLPSDNLADIAVSSPRRLRMASVGGVGFAVENVMRALPAEKYESLTREEFAARTASAGGSEFDVVVAAAGALPSPLPPGRYLIFGIPEGVEGLNPYAAKESLEVLSSRAEHPVLRAVNLNDLRVAKATAFAPASDVEPLFDSSATPLAALVRRGPMQAIILGFDPLDSNWPFQRGFVTFLANAVEWLGSIDQAAVQEEHRPGDALVARLPQGASRARMQPPVGDAVEVPIRDGVVSFGPVERAGVYTLTWQDPQGEGRRSFAVNPAAGEGYIAAANEITLGSQSLKGQGGGSSLLSDLWPYALAASILLLVLEWWVYHRKHWLRRAPQNAKPAPIIRAA